MLRAIREIQPSWVVGENVRGLTNWNGGMVFDEVQAELEAEGYEVLPFLLPACAVNAPHRRDRIWFVAHSKSNGWNGRERKQRKGIETNQREFCEHTTKGWDEIRSESQRHSQERDATNSNSNGLNTSEGRINALGDIDTSNGNGDVANTEFIRLQHGTKAGQVLSKERNTKTKRCKSSLSIKTNGYGFKPNWQNFPTVSPICIGDDGLSDRLDSITFSKWRNESIKAGGNAIVPQVVYQIFKAIDEYESIIS
jgi:DNA (cytosine-5)-methyltransferase 1